MGKVGLLSESEVRARLAIPASGFSFSSAGHLCFPSGRIWVASPSALADKAVTIRFRVTGNSSFDFGLVPRQKAEPDYLYQRGKFGINSTGTGGGVLRRCDCFNKLTELHVDGQARLLRVRVFADESWSSVSIEEKQTIDDGKEWCIALGGFNGTKYQIFSWAENQMAPDGTMRLRMDDAFTDAVQQVLARAADGVHDRPHVPARLAVSDEDELPAGEQPLRALGSDLAKLAAGGRIVPAPHRPAPVAARECSEAGRGRTRPSSLHSCEHRPGNKDTRGTR